MNISAHARKRMDQRAISVQWLEILEQFGSEFAQKGNTAVLDVPMGEVERVRGQLRALLKRLDHLSNVYAVVDADGTVITAAHRTRSNDRRNRNEKRRRPARLSVRNYSEELSA